jgi:hypothetical protein
MRGILAAVLLLAVLLTLATVMDRDEDPGGGPLPRDPSPEGVPVDEGLTASPESGIPTPPTRPGSEEISGTGTIEGRVVSRPDRPFTGPFRVRLLRTGPAGRKEISSRTIPAGDGSFLLTEVPRGRYVVVVRAVGSSENGASDPIDVAHRPVRDLRIVVGPYGSVSGVVVRADDGEPVPGARISCREAFTRSVGTTSGPDGAFHLSGISPGNRVLAVSADDLADGSTPGLLVEPGAETAGVVIRLGVGGSIRGVVYGPDGKPSPGARVLVMPVLEGMMILGDIGKGVVADASGAYRVDHLTPGRYRVKRPSGGSTPVVLIDEGESKREDPDDPVLVVREGEVVTRDLRADRRGTIRGTMRSTSGTPLRRQVSLLAPPGSPRPEGPPRFALPDEKGEFVLADIPPGEHVLEADGARTPVVVRAGQTTEVALVLQTGRVSGIVTDEIGAPVAGATVDLDRRGGSPLRVTVEVGAEVRTDDGGRFLFANATAGPYRLRAEKGGASAETEVFQLRPGEVRKGFVLRLDPTVEVRVLVRDAAGSPAANVPVRLGRLEARTGADGSAVFSVSPGTHWISAGIPPDDRSRTVRVERTGARTFTIRLK